MEAVDVAALFGRVYPVIAFDLASTDDALHRQFPALFDTTLSDNEIIVQARARLEASMQGYRQTMRVQAQQATNQLIALSTRQQLQIQQMMAAQYRADALERARQQQAMEAARERTRRFIGSADIYTRN